ncbi:MAG: choice-of-anchor D domain-containing protein [Thiotrichaceae bacterium]
MISAGYQSSPILPNNTIDCGTVQVGNVTTRTFDIYETANTDLNVGVATSELSGSHPIDFKVISPTFPIAIKDGSGERKTVTIQCQPSDVGTRTARLQLTTNDLSMPTVTYPLQVTGSNGLGSQLTLQTQGTGRGKITSDSRQLNCSTEAAGSPVGQLENSCVESTTALNSAHCDAYFDRGTQVTLTPQPEPGSVFVQWNHECSDGVVTLDSDITCIAEFALAAAVDSSDVEMVFLQNNELDFGTVNVGDAVTRTLSILNKTTRTLSLSDLTVPTGLLLETPETSIAAGQTIALTVHLDTTQPASVLGQLSFQIQGKAYQFAARAKVMMSDSQLTVSYPNAQGLDFGSVQVNDAVTREVMITNHAAQSITLDNVALPPEITSDLSVPINIAPQQAISLHLTLKPVVEGNYAASWSFTSQQKVYNQRAKAQVTTAQLADGCYAALRLYVNSQATGQGTGRTWTDAFPELQAALSYANQCNTVREIWVAVGTYRPTQLTDRTASFQLRNNLALYGGFKATEQALSERGLTTPTVLSGDIGQPNDMTDNSYHVVNGSDTDETTRLDGFNVVAGQADSGSAENCGGGMFNHHGSPQVLPMLLSHNYAKQGAGMCNQNGSHPRSHDGFHRKSSRSRGGHELGTESNPILALLHRESCKTSRASVQ